MDTTLEGPHGPAKDGTGAGWAATLLAGAGALLLTSCCVLPLALVSFGVTGVFIAQFGALYAYKWLTFAFAAGALAFGFWRAYRPVRCADGSCRRPVNRGAMRAVLWAAAAITTLAMAFPVLAPLVLPY